MDLRADYIAQLSATPDGFLGAGINSSVPAAEKLKVRTIGSETTKPSNPKDLAALTRAPMSVVPMTVLAETGVAMVEGMLKYGRHNYRDAGILSSIYIDAALRHIFKFWEGQDLDPDSTINHITKAIASLIVLRDGFISGNVTDDRPPVVVDATEFWNALSKSIEFLKEKYGDINPKHFTEKDI